MSTSRSPLSNQIIFSEAGRPLPGAKLFFFIAGTTTPLTVHPTADASTSHTHPVVASASGRMPSIFIPYGDYKQRCISSAGVVLWEEDDVPNPEPVSSTGGTDPLLLFSTGDIIHRFEKGVRAGWVRANGRSIGSASSSATERANADCEALFLYLWNNVARAEAPVSGGAGASAAADWAANKALTIPATIGRALFGVYGMGATTLTPNANASIPSGKEDVVGAAIGEEVNTLTTTKMPSHAHGGATQTTLPGNPTYLKPTASWPVQTGGDANVWVSSLSSDLTGNHTSHAHGITAEGGGQAHNNLSPGILVGIYVKL